MLAFMASALVPCKGFERVNLLSLCSRTAWRNQSTKDGSLEDLGPEVLDNVLNLEEFGRGFEPNPTDTFLVTKRWLADHTVLRAICVVPESMAKNIRTGFTLPRGTAPRRSISEKVRKNIQVQDAQVPQKKVTCPMKLLGICCSGALELWLVFQSRHLTRS